jgi:hypothetical protein
LFEATVLSECERWRCFVTVEQGHRRETAVITSKRRDFLTICHLPNRPTATDGTHLLHSIIDRISTLANNSALATDGPGSPVAQGESPVRPVLIGSLPKLMISVLSAGLKVLGQEDRLSGLENRVWGAVDTALADLRSLLKLLNDRFS